MHISSTDFIYLVHNKLHWYLSERTWAILAICSSNFKNYILILYITYGAILEAKNVAKSSLGKQKKIGMFSLALQTAAIFKHIPNHLRGRTV